MCVTDGLCADGPGDARDSLAEEARGWGRSGGGGKDRAELRIS